MKKKLKQPPQSLISNINGSEQPQIQLGRILVKCRDTTLNPNFLKIPWKVCNVSNARTSLDLLKNNRIDTVAIITLINSVRNAKVSKSQKEIILFSFLSKNKRKSFLDSAPRAGLLLETAKKVPDKLLVCRIRDL